MQKSDVRDQKSERLNMRRNGGGEIATQRLRRENTIANRQLRFPVDRCTESGFRPHASGKKTVIVISQF